MAAKTRTIEIEAGSELERQINDAGDAPVVLIVAGTRYALYPEGTLTPASYRDDEDTRHFLANLERRRAQHPDEGWEHSSPERARAILRETAGAWSDVDVDELKEMLRQVREEGSRSWDRPKSLDAD
jgi:hypothetical protein